MILDSSSVVAILKNEPEGSEFQQLVAQHFCSMSAANFLETAIFLDSRDVLSVSQSLDTFLFQSNVKIVPVTETQALIARAAYRKYGKGSGHPARLNFGDCFAYALAQDKQEPLLFKGNDFSQTDVLPFR